MTAIDTKKLRELANKVLRREVGNGETCDLAKVCTTHDGLALALKPMGVLAILDTIGLQQEQIAIAKAALEFYAGLRDGATWDNRHVCDSYSGALATFDWNGEVQDEPWDIARAALKRMGVK